MKQLSCEVQVRTVVQDAWAIIQHHMIYKRESQVPTKLQRKLNSLVGLFETVDDQFERIREEREAYVAEVRGSADKPAAFLDNELNLDSFKEYLKWRFAGRVLESWEGQAHLTLDGLLAAGHKTLLDVENIMKRTADARDSAREELEDKILRAQDGTLPATLEPALALSFSAQNWDKLIMWLPPYEEVIKKHRTTKADSLVSTQ